MIGLAMVLVLATGCAKYNTFYNAQKSFDQAERAREERLKLGEEVSKPTSSQKQQYDEAIKKAQKILDRYPGHSLTDDALFLQGKAYHRLAGYRMSIRKLDLLFTNFPQTEYLEETLFLQAVNYLMLGNASESQNLLDQLERRFPESRFQSEALRASADNAYALEDWEDAVDGYRAFLERFPEAENWDDSSQRLAEALWELRLYEEAVPVLQRVVDESLSADRVFRARLLLAKCLIRMGDYPSAEALMPTLTAEGEIYSKQGEVQLVDAENLVYQDRQGDALAMLERMPEEQLTPQVKPVRQDMMGWIYLDQGELEEARNSFQQALSGGQLLDDVDRTRQLLNTIRDYLAAEGQLPDADPPRAARLRLLQANAMLFGFERPREAFDLYADVAADTAADSTLAPRALYGAMLVQATYFEQADSAEIYAIELEERFPDSPQAYQVRSGADANLLAFLKAQEEIKLAAMRPDSLVALADSLLAAERELLRGEDSGLRRRQVYLQRREFLLYPPPEAAVQKMAHDEAAASAARQQAAGAAAVVPMTSTPGETLSFDGAEPLAAPDDSTLVPLEAAVDTVVTVPEPEVAPVDTVKAPPPEEEPKEKPKKKKQSWDL